MSSSRSWGLLLLTVLTHLLSAPAVTGAKEKPKPAQAHPEHAEEPACQHLLSHLTDLFFSLFRETAQSSKDSNVMLSPLSLTAALAMLLAGSRGDSHTQILQSLELHLTETNETLIQACFQHLLQTFQHAQGQLTAGSFLFVDQSVTPRDAFLEDIKQLSHPEAITINLNDTPGAKMQINAFLRRESRNEIRDLVGDLENGTTLALVAYASFHGNLQDEFHTENMVEKNFFVNKKTTLRVPTINRLGAFDLHRDASLSSWVLVQHYMGDTVAFFVLPDPEKMEQLERGMTKEQFNNLLRSSGDIRPASLYFPKFSISGTYHLKPLLGKLGITKVFSNEADFSGITEQAPLKLSQAVHRAVLTTEEQVVNTEKMVPLKEGEALITESTYPEDVWSPQPISKFNSPFLVILKDDNTNFPIFLGKVVNPTQP
ncbi:putative alpha-1-antitrypsin-related protein [Ochotona curzoniae]|uniref:putative alpha-1-antitrypsin-related protein n=1 Tax=Ochotona curzoniae TaxID=130825 RepID=UPI001B3490E6|nr:putative alpha-1-antitrypsin-related protein [Ochotona curzoniae]